MDKTSAGAVTYYPAAGAMRINSTLYFILKDHLGSASVVTDASGTVVGEQRYYPYGETRFTTGTIFTDKLFTGQREITGLGIYHYNARFYSPKIGRFLSPDTIVPGAANPQAWNRYSYVLNNPLKYTDPTGHKWKCTGANNDHCYDDGKGEISGMVSAARKHRSKTPTPTTTSTPTATPTATGTSTGCPAPYLCPATSTPSPTPTGTPYSGPAIGPANSGPTWEFPYTIGVKDPFDLGVDIAGIIGDGTSVLGAKGKIVWALTEGAEVVGVGKDIYDLTLKKDASGISNTFFFQSAEKLAPDLMRMQNPGIISIAGNIWSISQNITITPK